MAWRYRKRIKLIPGVHLNLSKSGISTSIGVRGANLTFSKSGTYLNTGIPGSGFYYREKISKNNYRPSQKPIEVVDPFIYEENEIFSEDVQEITSQNMQGIKDAILLAHQQRKELNSELLKIKSKLIITKIQLIISYILIYGFIKKDIPERINADIKAQGNALLKLKSQIENCYVNLEIDFDKEFELKYSTLLESFKKVCTAHKIWDITSASSQDAVRARSSAGKLVKKKEVRFGLKSLPYIQFNYNSLYFQNANGPDLYFYPNFIVVYSSNQKFAIIGIEELDFYHGSVRFTENGNIPKDSKIIDKTWAKVNKNGTRDKRFKGNYQIPVVEYGEFRLSTETGLNEEYELSNYEFSEEFATAFKEYQNLIKRSGTVKNL